MTKIVKNTASRQVCSIFKGLQTWAHRVIFPKRSNYQKGFVPLLIILILIILAVIFVVYLRVEKAQG